MGILMGVPMGIPMGAPMGMSTGIPMGTVDVHDIQRIFSIRVGTPLPPITMLSVNLQCSTLYVGVNIVCWGHGGVSEGVCGGLHLHPLPKGWL